MGHLFGVGDLYSRELSADGKSRTFLGVDPRSIMGAGLDKLTQKTVDEMSDYVLSKSKDGNKLIIDASEVSFRDKKKARKAHDEILSIIYRFLNNN